jgi:hypothetical protein
MLLMEDICEIIVSDVMFIQQKIPWPVQTDVTFEARGVGSAGGSVEARHIMGRRREPSACWQAVQTKQMGKT